MCVIGAGTMGGGIAAHLANLGFNVTMLDATHDSAAAGLDRLRIARPPAFYVPERVSEIRVGNVQEHLYWVTEADWVCEAVVEKFDVKRSLYSRIDPLLSPDAMVTSNTSGLPIHDLAEGMSETFRRRFMGAHFFNPPRHLRLLELIPTAETHPSLVAAMETFLEEQVARRVVLAKDTPGFIANRFGMWSMFHAVRVAEKLQMSVEDVDAITGGFLGRPRSGTFRLNDIVGLDVMKDIADSLVARRPDDPNMKVLEVDGVILGLLARGWIGDKSGQGFYRREGKDVFSLELSTMAYRQYREPTLQDLETLGKLPLGERIREALGRRSEVSDFLREYLLPTLRYANEIKEEVSYSVEDFDRVMKWGFGWELGPFALIDAIGHERLGIQPAEPFYKDHSVRSFHGGYTQVVSKTRFKTLEDFQKTGSGDTYETRDLGDGVTAVALTTKMGVISPKAVSELTKFFRSHSGKTVLMSSGRSYSAGFDLSFFAEAIAGENFAGITDALANLQKLGELLEERACVALAFGHCLGAGLELALSCPFIVVDAETQIGFPETKVGLIPGGRGTALMRLYNAHSTKRLCEIVVTLADGAVAPNAEVARQMGYLRSTDRTVYSADQLLWEAKKTALEAHALPRPAWTASVGPLIGMIDREFETRRAKGLFSEYDEIVGGKIRQIVARSISYEDALVRERTEFVDLCGRALTQARIRHMLENKKPLRN